MEEVRALIHQLRSTRAGTVAQLAAAAEAALDAPVAFRGVPATLRMRLSLLAELDDGLRGRVFEALTDEGVHPTPAQSAAVVLGAARGALEGTLLGLSLDTYEAVPAEGEWPLRRVLAHVIANDLRYFASVRFACERATSGRGGPLRPPPDSMPPSSGETEDHGTPEALLERLRQTRDDIMAYVAAIPDNLLDAPTNWIAWDFDLRFRLYRFASHDREHTIQVRKTRGWLGLMPTETQLLLADAGAARGGLEAALLAIPDRFLTTGRTADKKAGKAGSLREQVEQVDAEERQLHSAA